MPQITQLGWIMIPLCLLCYNKPQRLLSIAIFSTAFGAASVVNLYFGGFGLGIIPPYFPGLVFISLCVLRYLTGQTWGTERAVARIYFPFILFTLYCILVTVVMPQLMAGRLLVWPQRNDIFRVRVLLYFGTGNISQLSYVIFDLVFCFLATCYVARKPWIAERLLTASLLSGYVVVFFGVWQFASKLSGLYFPETFLYSNEFATVNSEQTLGSAFRVSGSFNEPASLASHVCGTVYATFWLILTGDQRGLVLGLFVSSIMLVLLSTSTTGYILLAVGIPGMIILTASSAKSEALLRVLKISLGAGVLLAAVIVTAPLISPEVGKRASEVLQATLEKADSQSYDERTMWDTDALGMVAPTYGFGVGWGSLRSSSLGPALLGGTGIWGFVLFAWFILRVIVIVRWTVRRLVDHPSQVRTVEALSASAVAILFSALLAGPNLNAMDAWLPLAAALGVVAKCKVGPNRYGRRSLNPRQRTVGAPRRPSIVDTEQ